jgi:hypothetical protein
MRFHVLLLLVSVAPAPAWADIPPPPGAEERYRAEVIREAGYLCNGEPRLERATAQQEQDFVARRLNVVVARCAGGERYLVGTPFRRRGAPRPDDPPPARPEVVKLN